MSPRDTADPHRSSASSHAPHRMGSLEPSAEKRRSQTEALGEEIALLSAQIQAATYVLLVKIREFDESEGWTGFASCAAWAEVGVLCFCGRGFLAVSVGRVSFPAEPSFELVAGAAFGGRAG